MKIHIVQKGDTLWTIAKKYGVNFEELKKMNAQLSNPDLIMPGMKIKVPVPGGAPHKEVPKEQGEAVKEKPVAPPKAPVKEIKPTAPPAPVKEKVKIEKPAVMPPPMPPVIPEVEINQIFQMNTEQIQQMQQMPPAPAPVPQVPVKPDNIFPGLTEKEKEEEEMESPMKPMTPPIMPQMTAAPQPQGGCAQFMNQYMSMYPMAPQAQEYGMNPASYPQSCVPMQQAPAGYYHPPMHHHHHMHHGAAGMHMESSDESSCGCTPMTYPMAENQAPIAHPNNPAQAYPAQMNPYPAQSYPTQTYPAQMLPAYNPGSSCVPVSPVMPGTGFNQPWPMMPAQPMAGTGYGMESPEVPSAVPPASAMGAYSPQSYGAYPTQPSAPPYMYSSQPVYPAGGSFPPPYGMGMGMGWPRFDEEDDE